MPELRGKLEKTSDELSKLMEKISGKEKVINKNFAHIVDEYKVHADKLKDIKQKSGQLSESNQKQQEMLLEISEKFDEVQVISNHFNKVLEQDESARKYHDGHIAIS